MECQTPEFMVLLYFSGRSPTGDYHECSLGAKDTESCLDRLSVLVEEGWQLLSVKLSEYPGSATWLPVEAFDGQPIKRPLRLLQRQWEEILYQN